MTFYIIMFSHLPDDHDVISFATHSITSPSDAVSCITMPENFTVVLDFFAGVLKLV